VGLVVRPDVDVAADEPAEVPVVVAVDCELVHPATAIAQKMRKITAIYTLAFIPDDTE